jgi:cyclopropane-fatty-acyl-phospholipid synthase
LQPGMRILDINCSWGAFAKYAAEHYGVSVVGITISRHQALYAKKICAHLPVEIHYRDFRDVNEIYDRIVSIGMFEHVGHLNYRDYMTRIRSCLTHEGMFLLHTIGANQSSPMANNWITKYIFPGGMLPSISQIGTATEELLVMEDWHNFGIDYDKTLMEWHRNFNHNWTKISANYDEHFYRMWNYYLLSCAGGFRARALQVWQIVFSHSGLSGGYQGLR